jgi:type VI secretion system protein ImpJ
MSWESKVLWTEGLFLQPHHFQQADRHAEALVAGLASRIGPYAWGMSDIEIDRAVLKVGQIALKSGSGLTQDGTVFRIPETEGHPPALVVPSNIKDCVVYLTVPQRRQGAVEVDLSGAELSAARLRPAEIEVTDTTGRGQKSARIAVGNLRLQFALEVDDLADRYAIPIARIIEVRPDEEVVLDDSFIPSCLDLRAAHQLSGFLNELEGLLAHRASALSGRLTAGAGARGAAEIQDLLLLITINRALPVLRHLKTIENVHPVTFFRDCVSLAGELASFMAPEKRPSEYPPYRHHDLTGSYQPVIRDLRRFLSAVLEQTAVMIPIEPRKFGISVGVIADRKLIGSSNFVLAVSADVDTDKVRRHFADQAKVGPVEEIRQFVNSALPGIPLRALPVAPRQIPYNSNTVYFEVATESPYWARMTTSGGIAVHVSGEFPGLTLELWAIRRS